MIRDSCKLGPALWAFVGISAGTLVWRGLMIPWDVGGTWFHLWIPAAATIGFIKLHDAPQKFRVFGMAVVYLVGILLEIGSMYFAPQSLFYFLFLGGLVVLFCCVWPKISKPRTVAAGIAFVFLLVGLVYGCVDGVRHMCRVQRLKSLGLSPDSVQTIEMMPLLTNSNPLKTDVRIVDNKTLTTLLQALQATYPYSPNHESIYDPWQVTVRFRTGEMLTFKLGQGNRAHPETAWIGFDRGIYQNERLYQTLVAGHILPLLGYGRPTGAPSTGG